MRFGIEAGTTSVDGWTSMTTYSEDTELTDLSATEEAIDRLTWEDSERQELLGVEVEMFAIVTRRGRPVSRLPLHGADGVADLVAGHFGISGPVDGSTGPFPIPAGGHLSFEPGGQIEYSSTPVSDIATLRSEIDSVGDALGQVFAARSTTLVCLGLDPWHDLAQVPQQLGAGRYVAMDRYFSRNWPAGTVMMRNTCSLQVNLESGRGSVRDERWLAANLISPILSAMFSTSPGDGIAGRRAKIWQAIDPTRTGLPSWTDVDLAQPVEDTRTRSLQANVMFVNRGGATTPQDTAWSFEEWVRLGHPEFGRPTIADLQTHLSTLFPEVRPRFGTLELRAIDSLPRPWWLVPVVIVGTVLGNHQVRGQVIELLAPYAPRLHTVWAKAADDGLADAEFAALAGKVGQLALDAAIGDERFDSQSVEKTERFLDRFTLRGLAPRDELRPRLVSSANAVEWASAGPTGPGS